MHPDIVSEILGVELKNNYYNTVFPEMHLEEEPITCMEQRAEEDRNNLDHGSNVYKTYYHIKGVDDIIEIDSDNESDYDEGNYYIPRMVRRKDSDSRDYGSEVDPD